ncbi:hypothetical protein BTS2_0740 [Bacillus sp. TS-2]|nr:hypothetical protein BTS2_0740 [Bacillus sp. TS-2]
MHTQESILARFKEVGVNDTFGTKKEIKELPNILHDGEIIQYATSGLMENNTWLVVCTNTRIIFLDKGMIYGLKQKEIALNKINSIAQKRGLLLGEIHIWDGADKFQIKNCLKETVQPFVDATNHAISTFRQSQNSVVSDTQSNYSKIKELKELLDMGAITDEEFQKEKTKLLS